MTDPASHLIETFEDGIATLTMNRPEARNALSPEMTACLEEAVPRLARDPAVRVLVVTGAGDAFCEGGDVTGFVRTASAPPGGERSGLEQRVAGLRDSMELVRWLHEMPKPTLAAIPGPAAGGGLSIALAYHMRIAVETAKFTTAFAKIGLAGGYGGSYFLPHLVGAAKARELYFTAELIDAPEAERIGLVNRVYSTGEFPRAARSWARRLADLPTIALGYMKKNLNAAEHDTLGDVLDLEAPHMIRTFETEDHRRSARAFVDKVAPEFRGR